MTVWVLLTFFKHHGGYWIKGIYPSEAAAEAECAERESKNLESERLWAVEEFTVNTQGEGFEPGPELRAATQSKISAMQALAQSEGFRERTFEAANRDALGNAWSQISLRCAAAGIPLQREHLYIIRDQLHAFVRDLKTIQKAEEKNA